MNPVIAAALESSAARLEACLAQADPDAGVLAEDASEAAHQAWLLAGALQRPLDQGRAGAWRCTHLLRLGRHATVLHEAPERLAFLRRPELAGALAAEERELMRVLTLCACETGAFDIALDTAHELVRLTGPLGEDGPSLTAAFTLAVCFERMGDSWQSLRVLDEALQAHGEAASELALLIALNALCAISVGLFHRLRGAAGAAEVAEVLARAEVAGRQALGMLDILPDPVYEVAICGNLGEVLLHQGDAAAAQPLLQRAHDRAVERGLRAYRWRVEVTLGEVLLVHGEPARALADMLALIADMGDANPHQTAIRAHHAAYRACRTLGRFEEALHHFEQVELLERRRATAQLRAQSQLFVTRTEAQHAQWQAEQARQDAQAQRARAAEFAARAERDPLTALGNRRYFDRRAAELLPVLQAEGRPLAVVLIDVDRFKDINDRHGHAVGDQVLVDLAQLLRDNTRSRDVLARHGGEEFVVLMPGMNPEHAAEACERLRDCVAAHAGFMAGGLRLHVTVSLGLAAAPPYDVRVLLNAADQALYRAKREGRNRLCLAA